jgi:hypothetical protein
MWSRKCETKMYEHKVCNNNVLNPRHPSKKGKSQKTVSAKLTLIICNFQKKSSHSYVLILAFSRWKSLNHTNAHLSLCSQGQLSQPKTSKVFEDAFLVACGLGLALECTSECVSVKRNLLFFKTPFTRWLSVYTSGQKCANKSWTISGLMCTFQL